jgi:L-arabinose isomerase
MQEKFGDQYELVIPPVHVDTLDKAYDAGVYFKERGIDVIIIDEATYVTDFIPLQTIDLVPNVPIILLATQATSNLWDTMENTDVIRFEGLVGTTQLAGAFAKMGRKYRTVVGALEEDSMYEEIGMHLRTLQLIQDLKYMDIGFVGHTFRGMYDIEVDKTKIKGVFGPNVLYLDVTHLIDIWKALTEEQMAAFEQKFRSELAYRIVGIDDEDIRKICGLDGAVRLVITIGYPKAEDTLRSKKRKELDELERIFKEGRKEP